MRIVHIELLPFQAPLKNPFVTALRRVDRLESYIVKMRSQNGTVGYGEVAPTPPITGETKETIFSAFKTLSSMLTSKNDSTVEGLRRTIASGNAKPPTKAAFECALFDLASKEAGLPLWAFLSRRAKQTGMNAPVLHTDVTISLAPIEETLTMVEAAYRRGYRTVKIKLGSDVAGEIRRIKTVYTAFPKLSLRLDANQAFDVDGCLRLLQMLERDGIVCECIEQPLVADDIDGMAYVKARTQTPMLADESVFSYEQAETIIAAGAADMLNIKLAKTGGLSEATRIALLCRKHTMPAMIGCMLEGPVAVAAAAHVASAFCDTVKLIDLDAVDLLACAYRTEIAFEGPRIILNTTPGIGIDESIL